MSTNFTWSITKRSGNVTLCNNHLYELRHENKNDSFVYMFTFKSCSRTLTLKDNTFVESNSSDHNHSPKLLSSKCSGCVMWVKA